MTNRILIVDDHEIVREGIRNLVGRARPEWEICGEAKNGKEAIEAVKSLRPDVVILDVSMPVMSGLEAAPHIVRLGFNSRVLIFTMHESERLAAEVRSTGAHGYVVKSQAARDLILAVERLLDGGTFFTAIEGGKPEAKHKKEPNPGLSLSQALRSV
jgi:DNA-binding NarL/FixJ family response regulator